MNSIAERLEEVEYYTYSKEKQIRYLLFFTYCFQFTDVKIGFIKISEIILLLLAPFAFRKKMSYFTRVMLFFFTLLFIKTMFLNPTYPFFINADLPLLKQPYFVSFGRFLEILCCIVFVHITFLFFKGMSYKAYSTFLKRLVKIQVLFFAIPLSLLFLLCKLEIISFVNVFPLVYNTHANYGYKIRLAGFFVEGGPLGLMFAFVYILYDFVYKRYTLLNLLGRGVLVFTIVVAAQSKAGIFLLAMWYIVKFAAFFFSFKNSAKVFIFVLPVFIAIFTLVFLNVSEMYRGTYTMLSNTRSNFYQSESIDRSTVMGRVAGVFIVPNMISDHPLIGIGLGNYPLMRNSPYYRGPLPNIRVNLWDAHGLGGMVDILVDGGIIFFGSFLIILFLFYKRIRSSVPAFLPLILCLIGPFISGVQVHFLYPWFALGLLASLVYKANIGEIEQTAKAY